MSRRSCVLLATVALAACGGGETTGPGDSTPIARLVLGAPADTLLTRETFDGTATAFSATGTSLPDRPMTWSSSDETILSVTPAGRVTALRGGTATLTVSSGGVSASRELVVRTLRFTKLFSNWEVSCGLEATGDLWCWGHVPESGYGNGSAKAVQSPVPRRAALGHRFESLALGASFACGVEPGGAIACWGMNDEGQLGDGSRTPHFAPVQVAGLPPATGLIAGYQHVCARSASGAVSCWGRNDWGQLGDGTREDRLAPVPVQGLPAASALAAGYEHTCALTTGGPMCWGSDWQGELGHDTTYDRLVPTRAGSTAALSPNYTTVSAGDWHNCALSGGTAYCWGAFYTGAVDAIYDAFSFSPAVQAAGHQFTRLVPGGGSYDCGLEAGGDVWCWIFDRAPVKFPSAKPAVQIAGSYSAVCMLDADGVATCWHADEPSAPAPFTVTGAPPFVQIAVGSYTDSRACGLTAAGAVWCWSVWYPAPVTATLTSGADTFSSIWAGSNGRVCALTAAGDVACLSTAIAGFVPSVAGYGFTQLATTPGGACGLTAAGAAYCWGQDNTSGQLGDGTRTFHTTPAPVAGGLAFTSISAGYAHNCGTTAAGSIYCWGRTFEGELGDGTGPFSTAPRSVTGSPSFTALGAGGDMTCGLGAGGAAECWSPRRTVTTPAPLTQLAVGEVYGCGLDASGRASCWRSYNGGAAVSVPAGAPPFATISAGGGTNCGITAAGAAWCWGNNQSSNLGSPDGAGVYESEVPMRLYGQE